MSVSLSMRKSLGFNEGPDQVVRAIDSAVAQIVLDAHQMDVEVSWGELVIQYNVDYDTFQTLTFNNRIPYLEVTVPGERRNR